MTWAKLDISMVLLAAVSSRNKAICLSAAASVGIQDPYKKWHKEETHENILCQILQLFRVNSFMQHYETVIISNRTQGLFCLFYYLHVVKSSDNCCTMWTWWTSFKWNMLNNNIMMQIYIDTAWFLINIFLMLTGSKTMVLKSHSVTHTHTHTYTHIYIFIYSIYASQESLL